MAIENDATVTPIVPPDPPAADPPAPEPSGDLPDDFKFFTDEPPAADPPADPPAADPAVDPPAEPGVAPPPAEPVDIPGAEQFAKAYHEMARRERELLAQKQQVTSDAAEIAELRGLKDLAGKDVIGTLRKLGISPGDVLDKWGIDDEEEPAAPQASPEIAEMRKEIAALRADREQQHQQAEQGRQQQAMSGHMGQVASIVHADAEKFPLMAKLLEDEGRHGAAKDVVQFAAQNNWPSYAELVPKAEETWLGNFKDTLAPLATVPKFRDMLASLIGDNAGSPSDEPKPPKTQAKAPRTITSQMSAEPATTPAIRDMTDEEAEEATLQHIRNMWKADDA